MARPAQKYLDKLLSALCKSDCPECDNSRALIAEINVLRAERAKLHATCATLAKALAACRAAKTGEWYYSV